MRAAGTEDVPEEERIQEGKHHAIVAGFGEGEDGLQTTNRAGSGDGCDPPTHLHKTRRAKRVALDESEEVDIAAEGRLGGSHGEKHGGELGPQHEEYHDLGGKRD